MTREVYESKTAKNMMSSIGMLSNAYIYEVVCLFMTDVKSAFESIQDPKEDYEQNSNLRNEIGCLYDLMLRASNWFKYRDYTFSGDICTEESCDFIASFVETFDDFSESVGDWVDNPYDRGVVMTEVSEFKETKRAFLKFIDETIETARLRRESIAFEAKVLTETIFDNVKGVRS